MAGNKKQQSGRRSFLSGMLVGLFLAFALSSGMVVYLLGRNAARPGGELVDTIVLSPGDSNLRAQETLHFLSGRLKQPAGDPLEGVTVRLDGTDRSDVTDGQGSFYLADVRPGEQTLEVLSEDGALLGSLRLTLDFSAREGVSSSLEEGSASFQMPEDARLLEIALTLDEETGLSVVPGSASLVTKDGRLVSFENKMLVLEDGGVAVTPQSSLVTSQGYVVLPNQGVTITPQGSQILQPAENGGSGESSGEIAPGVNREEDGSVRVDDEVVIKPDGSIVLPDGEDVDGGTVGVITPGGGYQEVDPLPDPYEPSDPSNVPEADPSPDGDGSGEEEPSQEPTPEPTPQGLSIMDSGTGVSWQQKSVLDLFKNRYGQDRTKLDENGEEVLLAAPGDSGYYDFRLENPEDFDIAYTVAIQETSFHLPIKYSVIDSSDNRKYLLEERSALTNAATSSEILIPAGSVQNFRIEWLWPYEDSYYTRKYDKVDTAAGVEGGQYTVSVFIRAEQVRRGTGDETRYPGIRGETDQWYDRLAEQRKNSE